MNTTISSRRAFLRRATLLAAAPVIAPRGALGTDARASANHRLGIGFIGTGRQAVLANLVLFLVHSETQLVAVCDVDSWRLEQARRKIEDHYSVNRPAGWKGLQVTGDFREVLANPAVDAVMISTPDHWHAYMAIAAARAGKDVALEKPISLSVREGRAIADAMKRHGRVFRTDTEVRTEGAFQKLVQAARNGRLGRITSVEIGVPKEAPPLGRAPTVVPPPADLNYPLWLGPAPEAPYSEERVHPREKLSARPGWMQIQDYSQGMLLNWGAHLIDIAQWALNAETTTPVEVTCTGSCPDDLYNVPQAFEARYRYANGVELRYTMAGRPFVRVEGSDGWAEAEWWRGVKASRPEILEAPYGDSDFRARGPHEKVDFIEAVQTRRETQIPAEVGHRTCTVCQLAFIALKLGRRLRWDPLAERFIDDAEADRLLSRPVRGEWALDKL
ncbi:MAG: Gfo/Idh/MocA family oxidoreductase [Verrucomicrobia bacterium]|jgi:predicted dehydrogenase|nr:Gfo/Idh/MocA family oxidoreductase [Verrucomicrobiota bacterium]